MNYLGALDYIHGAGRFSSRASLCRIEALTRQLGISFSSMRFIHVAGTNGKGSTCAMLESILRRAGYKVGLFTSPYLIDFCERIQLNRKNIPHNRLADITCKVQLAAEEIVEAGVEKPNEFEIVTAIALEYFSHEQCDFVLWETGMGGAKDATNVIPPPLVSIITSISFDHMAQLGATLPEIAQEKCGVIKNGTEYCVLANNAPEVESIVREKCENTHVKLIKAGVLSGQESISGMTLHIGRHTARLHLLGQYQYENAANAVAAARCLQSMGFNVSDSDIIGGLENTAWSARMEVLSEEPPVLLDCAHNSSGFEMLLKTVRELCGKRKIVALTAMMEDKEHGKCLSMLGELCTRVYVTGLEMPRCLAPEIAACELEKANCEAVIAPKLSSALKMAYESLAHDEALIICGSVYLAGKVREIATK